MSVRHTSIPPTDPDRDARERLDVTCSSAAPQLPRSMDTELNAIEGYYEESYEEESFIGEEESTTTDSLQLFFRDIRKRRLLLEIEEIHLSKQIERGDLHAKEMMVEYNLRLVVSIAKHYRDQGLPFLDLIQEGILGLERAIEKFDWRYGFRLATYATWFIRDAISRAVQNQGSGIRVPRSVVEKRRRVTRAKVLLTRELGRSPTDHELVEITGVDYDTLWTLWTSHDLMSLDQLSHEPHASRKPLEVDCIALDHVAAEDITHAIKKALAYVNDREQRVLELRYGLSDDVPLTLEQVGTRLGLTRERVRQIEDNALTKLRSLPQVTHLRDFLP